MKRFALILLLLAFPSLASAQVVNWGDYEDLDQTIYLYFNTVGTDGVAETLAGSPDVEVFEDGSDVEIDDGVAEVLTASHNSVAGLNLVTIDLSQSAFESGKTYTAVLDAGTVDAVSVAGRIVGVFTVERYATDADLEAAVDASTTATNVTSILADTGTDGVVIANDAITAAKIAADAIGAAEVAAGAIAADAFAAGAIDATAIAADAIGASEIAADAIGSSETATGSIDANALADDAIDAGAMAVGAIAADAFAAGAIDAAAIAADAIGASELAANAITNSELATNAAQEVGQETIDTVVEGSVTLEGALRLLLAVLVNDSDVTGDDYVFRDLADTKDRVTGTTTSGDRDTTAVDATD